MLSGREKSSFSSATLSCSLSSTARSSSDSLYLFAYKVAVQNRKYVFVLKMQTSYLKKKCACLTKWCNLQNPQVFGSCNPYPYSNTYYIGSGGIQRKENENKKRTSSHKNNTSIAKNNNKNFKITAVIIADIEPQV